MSRHLRRVVPSLLACALGACAGAASTAKPTAPQAAPTRPERELPERKELPLVIRETLSASMERHGEELSFLLVSVVLLNYDGAERLAQLIADEPKLGRPLAGETDSLNAMLPAGFFEHQDQLTQRARGLALAAREKNDAKLAKAFGALAETCVGCHSTYLHDELEALRTAGY